MNRTRVNLLNVCFVQIKYCLVSLQCILEHYEFHNLLSSVSWSPSFAFMYIPTYTPVSLNEAECVYLRFSPHLTPCKHSYTLSNRPIQSSTSHRDLGVILTSDLSFSSHIQKITSEAYKILGLVRRTFHCPSTIARLHLYTSLIRSQLTYCSVIW